MIGTGLLFLVVAVFVLMTLLGVMSVPIQPGEAPAFVGRRESVEAGVAHRKHDAAIPELEGAPEKLDESRIAEIVQEVVLEEKPTGELIRLLDHSVAEIRVLAARALAGAVRSDWTTQESFWPRVDGDMDVVRNALFEALTDSVENRLEGDALPYAITLIPGHDEERLELLAWTADSHQSPHMRLSAMYGVYFIAPRSKTATQVLRQRASDPAMKVRWEALVCQVTRWRD